MRKLTIPFPGNWPQNRAGRLRSVSLSYAAVAAQTAEEEVAEAVGGVEVAVDAVVREARACLFSKIAGMPEPNSPIIDLIYKIQLFPIMHLCPVSKVVYCKRQLHLHLVPLKVRKFVDGCIIACQSQSFYPKFLYTYDTAEYEIALVYR